MLTPQEIQEKTFEKAVFGGYDMQGVDEFLEPLTEDYLTLYRENAVLKSKMKVLVEKLEEYRSQEEAMRKAMVSAQRTADAMVAEAERKCAQMQSEMVAMDPKTQQILREEQERINCARQTALSFVELVEKDLKAHLELLETLKTRDMKLELGEQEAPKAAERPRPFDYEEGQAPLVVPKAESTSTTEEIAQEIHANVSRIMNMDESAKQAAPRQAESHPESETIKFTNLQFGRNYDPTQE